MSIRPALRHLGLGVVVLLTCAWSLIPIAWIFVNSFKPPALIFDMPPTLLTAPTLINYRTLVEQWPRFFDAVFNSVIVSGGAILLTLVVSLTAGYSISRYKFSGRNTVAALLIVVRMLPPIILIIPLFPVAHYLGLIDSYSFLIVLYAAFAVSFSAWVAKSFLDNVPVSGEEAALIDGCTRTQAFFLVVLPEMTPAIATIAIYSGVSFWNEYLFGFVFTRDSVVTAPVVVAEMLSSVQGLDWGSLFAATTILVAPVLVLTWIVQRKLVSGFTLEGGDR